MNTRRTGDEHIVFDGMPTGYLLQDFWAWNSSNLLNNTLRGAYCEFLVATSIGADLSGVNNDWNPYDILMEPEGVRIEIKSASYLQAWEQSKLSDIRFSIRPTHAWSPETGYAAEMVRQSDVYVFCLYKETVRDRADPLVLDGWDFYIVPTSRLNDACDVQKTLSFSSLLKLDPIKADYSSIKAAILSVA
jgi:hypothetical protein